jgi:hypothetical protein
MKPIFILFQYHGHTIPECCNADVIKRGLTPSSKNCYGTPVQELLDKTDKEKALLLSKDNVLNYNVMWECTWDKFKKDNKLHLANFWAASKLDPKRPLLRLVPRCCVRGGLVEVYQLFAETAEGSQLNFFDHNSMYSYISKHMKFPIGEYEIVLETELQKNVTIKNNKILYKNESCECDIAHVSVLAPSHLKAPFLAYRLNDQVYYSNCLACLKTKQCGPCRHKCKSKRRFTSTWTVLELNYALELGYEIEYFYEMYHYSQSALVLSDFVNVIQSLKLKNSDLLAGVSPSEHNEVCDSINTAMNFHHPALRLTPCGINPNNAQKQFFKDILNSLFGRFALHSQHTSRIFLKSQYELNALFATKDVEVLEFFPVNSSTIEAEILKTSSPNTSREGNLIFTALINAGARIYMHKLMQTLENDGCSVLYMDTDSILFSSRLNYAYPFAVGVCPGQFKAVLGSNAHIKKFYCLGPRNYCLLYEKDGVTQYVTKIKGINCTSQNLKNLITPSTYETFLKSYFNDQIQQVYIPQMRRKVEVQTKSFKNVLLTHKFSNELHLKRFILKKDQNFKTYPYGYNFRCMSDMSK